MRRGSVAIEENAVEGTGEFQLKIWKECPSMEFRSMFEGNSKSSVPLRTGVSPAEKPIGEVQSSSSMNASVEFELNEAVVWTVTGRGLLRMVSFSPAVRASP